MTSERKPTADMKLMDFMQDCYAPERRCKRNTVSNLRKSVRSFQAAIGREPLVSDLRELPNHGLPLCYVRKVITLWRYAAKLELVEFSEGERDWLLIQEFEFHKMSKVGTANLSPDTQLIDFVMWHYMRTSHGNRAKQKPGMATLFKLRRICELLSAHVDRPATIDDLTLANCNAISDRLSKQECQFIVSLWRYAFDLGIVLLPYELRRGKAVVHCHPDDPKARYPLVDSPQTLWGLCNRDFFSKNLRLTSEHTRHCYALAFRAFAKHLDRQPQLSDLNDDTLTAWVKAMIAKDKWSMYSIRERMGRVLTLWNWCAKRRIVEQFPTITRPEGPEPEPLALTQEQLSRLFVSAAQERGRICGMLACNWWQAWLAFIYCTGERCGAGLRLRWEWVDLDRGVASIPAKARKGGKKRATYSLWPEVVEKLRMIYDPHRELVFQWELTESSYYQHFGRILKRAGLPNDRKHKTHCLRATHATAKAVMGADASKSLLHSDPATTQRHYIDQRHLPLDTTKLPIPWLAEAMPSVSLPPVPPTAAETMADAAALAWL